MTNDFSNNILLLCFVLYFYLSCAKVAHINLHTQLLMAITNTMLLMSRPTLNYAAVINYLLFVFVVKDLTSVK